MWLTILFFFLYLKTLFAAPKKHKLKYFFHILIYKLQLYYRSVLSLVVMSILYHTKDISIRSLINLNFI